jgi:hypothetical protein
MKPFYQRAVPSTLERFAEMSSLRAGDRRLTSRRKDIGLACAHYTAYINAGTSDETAAQALAYRISLPPCNSLLRRCPKFFHKLLRTEYLRTFSTLDLTDFPQSRHEASTLLYSMTKELHHSHQKHRVFSGATACIVRWLRFINSLIIIWRFP